MTAVTLLEALRERGLDLRNAGGRLEVRPSGRLTPVERAAVRSYLPELLVLLAWDREAALRAMEAADALAEESGVRGCDPHVRAGADAVTRAYAAQDAVAFHAAVEAFRACVRSVAGHEHA